jgi:uncharacterized protein YjbI with pentapeptide repeats
MDNQYPIVDPAGDAARKLDLEIQKLDLETQQLEFQVSPTGRRIEWLKTLTVLATLIGAFAAVYIGLAQINQNRQGQSAELFDKTLARLVSRMPEERMAGISGMRLVLTSDDGFLKGSALQYLISAVAVEKDPAVQAEILNTLSGVNRKSIGQEKLDESLRSAVRLNQAKANLIREEFNTRLINSEKEKIAQFRIPNFTTDASVSVIPRSVVEQLTLDQYLELMEVKHGVFEALPADEKTTLNGLGRAIQILVDLGAKTKDFTGIYCQDCDFGAAKNLDDVIFDKSFLVGANFSQVSLKNSSFRNASLAHTTFFHSNLRGADLSDSSFLNEDSSIAESKPPYPYLECADLRGANLSGRVLFMIRHSLITNRNVPAIHVATLASAIVDSTTKMNTLSITSKAEYSDAYWKNSGNQSVFLGDLKNGMSALDEQFSELSDSTIQRRQRLNDYSDFWQTTVIAKYAFGDKNAGGLAGNAYFSLAQLSLSKLKVSPGYAKFVAAFNSKGMPATLLDYDLSLVSQAAQKKWNALEPINCNAAPNRRLDFVMNFSEL